MTWDKARPGSKRSPLLISSRYWTLGRPGGTWRRHIVLCRFWIILVYWQFLSKEPKLHQQTQTTEENLLQASFYSRYCRVGYTVDIISWRKRKRDRNREVGCQRVGQLLIHSTWWLIPRYNHGMKRNLGGNSINALGFSTAANELAVFVYFSVLYENLKKVHRCQDSTPTDFKVPPLISGPNRYSSTCYFCVASVFL